jgi:hypothetical protein
MQANTKEKSYRTKEPPQTPRRPTNRRRFQVSPGASRGAALELQYWDRARKVTIRLRLRRFEIGCLAIVLSTLIAALVNSGFNTPEGVVVDKFIWLLQQFRDSA